MWINDSYFQVGHDATKLHIARHLPRRDLRHENLVKVADILAWCEKIATLVPDWSAITIKSANLRQIGEFCNAVPPELDRRYKPKK